MTLRYELPLLDPSQHPTKTIDFGHDGISASLSTHGRFLSVAAFHPKHGQVLAEPFEQFPADRHHDQAFVRKYRARATRIHDQKDAGFGLSFEVEQGGTSHPLEPRAWSFLNGSWPSMQLISSVCSVDMRFSVSEGRIVQHVSIHNLTSQSVSVQARWTGDISVNRAAYTQLTPQGDCSIPEPKNDYTESGDGTITVVNPHLPAVLHMSSWIMDGEPARRVESSGPVAFARSQRITLPPNGIEVVQVGISLSPEPLVSAKTPSSLPMSLTACIEPARLTALLGDERLTFLVIRNLDYMLSCCTMPAYDSAGTSKGTCIITDHQCLPLGWNRDNYWQVDMLFAVLHHARGFVAKSHLDMFTARLEQVVVSHLIWVFRHAQRPHGYWARSYFASGFPKDRVFQLDQQCYPLLEIAQLALQFPEHLHVVRDIARGTVDEILDCLQEHRWEGKGDRRLWLFETDETPADDEVAYPYHFSSHILLWYTLTQLAELQRLVGTEVIRTPVAEWAARVRADTLEYFTVRDPHVGRVFAYLVSTHGDYQLYHDANDLPTALAPRWGFCAKDHATWQNTLRYAFSPLNVDGWYPGGRFGGLGSVHTRDPWPLGDGQALAISRDCPDLLQYADRSAILNKIKAEVQWDGMFSEAIDRYSGAVTSKSWFSWPGSFIASSLLRCLGNE